MLKEYDWNESWKQLMTESSWNSKNSNLIDFWNRKAKEFNKNNLSHNARAQEMIKKLQIKEDKTIIDVGAGTGALAIPIAKIAKYVTAVEPSDGMLNYLIENAKAENVKNIIYINKKWDDILVEKDIKEHDIVFASYSLAMLDIKDALVKMNQLAKEKVYLFTHASREKDMLWEKINGCKYEVGPDYIHIVNVLYQMGIYANVEIKNSDFIQKYESIDNAVQVAQQRYNNYSPETEKIIRKHFEETLIQENNYFCSKIKRNTATIYWNK